MAPNLWPDLVHLSSILSWRFSSRFGFGYEKTSDFLKDFIIYLVQQSISGQNLGHSDCYFFENLSIGSKVMKIFVLIQIFGPKIVIFGRIDGFDDVTLIFEDGIG